MMEHVELQKVKAVAEEMIRDCRGDSVIESPARIILILLDVIEQQEKANEILRGQLKALRRQRQT